MHQDLQGKSKTIARQNSSKTPKNKRKPNKTTNNDDFNPFGDGGPEHPEETLESYAAHNIVNMNGRNMEYLADFMERMPEPLIRFAIDTANKHCRDGVPSWGYVETILKSYEAKQFTTVEQAQMAEEARRGERVANRRSEPRETVLPGKFY